MHVLELGESLKGGDGDAHEARLVCARIQRTRAPHPHLRPAHSSL
jgi:hypothetical protein